MVVEALVIMIKERYDHICYINLMEQIWSFYMLLNDSQRKGVIYTRSRNLIIEEVTDDFLKKLKTNYPNGCKPSILASDLIDAVNDVIALENEGRSKGNKLKPLIDITPLQAAALILSTAKVICVDTNPLEEKDEHKMLAVYADKGEKRGTYSTDENDIKKLIQAYSNLMTEHEINSTIDNLMRYAKTKIENDNRDLVAVNNGIFDFKNKVLLPFSPEYVFLSKSNVNYVHGATSPVIVLDDGTIWDIESWIRSISDDDEIEQLLWQILSAIVRPHVNFDKAIWLTSYKGCNGKGCFSQLCRSLLGPKVCVSIPISRFSREFGLQSLVGAKAIITDENNVNEFGKECENIKALVTHDAMYINRKNKSPISYRFNGLMIQCLNAIPRFADRTESFYRRQIIVPSSSSRVEIPCSVR